jgi:3-deoxy-D-manno-octulosonic-acid transferase
MYFRLYNVTLNILTPFIYIYILIRIFKGKEDLKRIKERFGVYKKTFSEGGVIWFHAASLGEAISLLTLVEKLTASFPKCNFLFTSGTVNSAKVLAQRLPKNAIHQYIPIDKKSYVNRFLNHFKPDVGIFVESELWPNLIIESSKKNVELILVNAKLSDKSYQKAKKHKEFYKLLFSKFSLVMAQSDEYKEKLTPFVSNYLVVIKNLKFDSNPLKADAIEVGNYLNQLRDKKVFLAVSTHEGEEQIIINAHRKLKEKFKNLVTIICPRHPIRTKSIEKLIEKAGLNYALRTNTKSISASLDIYLVNTVGELGLFFRIAEFCFVGGSLVPNVGGHNPIEPAKLNLAVLSGSYVENFKEIYEEMQKSGAVRIVEDENDLIQKVDLLFSDKVLLKSSVSASFKYTHEKSGGTKEVLKAILPILQKKFGISNIPN